MLLSDFEKALDMAKNSVFKHDKTVAQAMDAVRILSKTGFFNLSNSDLDAIDLRLFEYFEKINQDHAFIIEDKRRYRPWVATTHSDKYYSNRYVNYLKQHTNMAAKPIQTMLTDSMYILDRLGNPQSSENFKRKGLVVGHVQSGKTANYISLINLAADYGYKLIILIAGVHNNLRSQTQGRINEGFIGYDQLIKERIGVGALVGVEEIKAKRPITFTNTQDDFSTKNRDIVTLTPEATQVPIILVIKKNGSVLRSILQWLQQDNDDRAKYILNYPALIIDDEADNASINTKKLKNPDEDPTTINRLLRELVNQFKQVSYVGYTATPFANIFIDPDIEHQYLGDDLFPDDFIVNLETPSNYCGPQEFFGLNQKQDDEDEDGKEVSSLCEIIYDYQDAIPIPTPKDHAIVDLPTSLKTALKHFLIGMTVKNLRKVSNKHASMLINVAHRTHFQSEVSELVRIELDKITKAVRFEGGKNLDVAAKNKQILDLLCVYQKYFDETEFTFDEILKHLIHLIQTVQIREINSTSKEQLDYANYKESGLNVIAVGGFSLSRGFTLEGLITSYLLRNTAMADTLLQMSRWFGYRDGFVDLCKVFMPEKTYNWYAFIGRSMEELRNEFRSLRSLDLTPRQYGLRVRSSPAGLMITAKNKMQTATYVQESLSYSASSYELQQLALNEEINQKNLQLLLSLHADLAAVDHRFVKTNKLYSSVSVKTVLDFLTKFEYVHKSEIALCLQYIQDGKEQELKFWDVAFVSNARLGHHKLELDGFSLHAFERSFKTTMFSDTQSYASVALNDGGGRIARIWEETIGLSEGQIQEAELQRENAKPKVRQTAIYYRLSRERPLLIVKLMDIKLSSSVVEESAKLVKALVPGFAISFPKSKDNREVTYQVNKVYYKKLLSHYDEVEDDEEITMN